MLAQSGRWLRALLLARLRNRSPPKICRQIFGGERFGSLASENARAQRPLWASTGTKNLNYGDTKYVEALIGPDTINTLPIETLNAYREHGHPEQTLDQEVHRAYHLLNKLSIVGIDLNSITQQLEDEGVEKFITAYNQLLNSLREKKTAMHELHGQ